MQDLNFACLVCDSACNLAKSLLLPEVSSENRSSMGQLDDSKTWFPVFSSDTREPHVSKHEAVEIPSSLELLETNLSGYLLYKSARSSLAGLFQSTINLKSFITKKIWN